MPSFNLKTLVLGASATAALAIPSVAMEDPACGYVTGGVDNVTVPTPAVIIPVPDSSACCPARQSSAQASPPPCRASR